MSGSAMWELLQKQRAVNNPSGDAPSHPVRITNPQRTATYVVSFWEASDAQGRSRLNGIHSHKRRRETTEYKAPGPAARVLDFG